MKWFRSIVSCVVALPLWTASALASPQEEDGAKEEAQLAEAPLDEAPPSGDESAPELGPGTDAPMDAALEPASGGATENTDWLRHRVDLLDELTFVRDGTSLFNPGGSLYSNDRRHNSLRLNGEFSAQLPQGMTIKTQVTSALSTGRETVAMFSIRELYGTASLGDFELSVGRKILRWTNGYAFTPAGLLEPVRNPSDPQDRLRMLEGLEMAQLDYFRGDHVYTAVFSTNALFRTPEQGQRFDLAMRGNFLFNALNLDIAFEALVSNVKNIGAMTASYVFGDALELHGEIAGNRGSSVVYPRSILPGNQESLFGADYLGQLKLNETRLFLRYLVGVNYTLPWGTNLIGEYYRSDEGLSVQEWERFLAQANFSRDQLATGQHPPVFQGRSLPALDLLQGLQVLSRQSIRRNYLFLRAADSWLSEQLAASALILVSMDDRSMVAVGDVSYLLRKGATLYARGTYITGSGTSEFANLGRRASLNAGVVLSF